MVRFLRFSLVGLFSLTLLACALHVSNSGEEDIAPKPPKAVRIASHNVHYILLNADDGRWSVTDWETRKGALDATLKTLDADVVAFQEMESFSRGSDGSVNLARDFLLQHNPEYALAASGDWQEFPSTQPIFYRRDQLELKDQGWFFFSETPHVIYSRTFNGSYPAFSSWALFKPKDGGPEFFVYNIHFEYKSRSNRRLSAQLVRDQIAARVGNGAHVVLAGDLNALYGSHTMGLLEEAGLKFAQPEGSTYHFDRGINLFGAIDHIGVSPGVRLASDPVVVRQQFDGQWPSDHYPVFVDIAFDR
ncbi:endonuclease/exonuclease/phosphatase family protein (plasmid) [Rhodobacteraceae bacterium SC52]|nr:endonuclease/exonuclease/phosphatase family protein [Rhodobacteraceae bacterium SC52]